MSRLIYADSLVLFPNNPESGTKVMIDNWIDECGLSNLELYITEDCPVDIEHALTELCWKVIQGYINVIETEPTAYDVDKVLKKISERNREYQEKYRECQKEEREMAEEIFYQRAKTMAEAYDIVKAGGIDG